VEIRKRREEMMNVPKLSEMTTGQKVVYGIGMLVVLAILGPLAAMAAATVTNILTAAIYGGVLFVGILMFPVFSRFVKTMALKLMKANARMNPIETLELDFQSKYKSLEKFAEFVKQMDAAQRVSQQELNDLAKQFPNRDLSDRQKMMDRMDEAVKLLKDKVAFVKADNAWAQRAGGAMKQLKAVNGGVALDELLKNEAIGQVRQDVATAFAELDELLDQEDTKQVLQITHDKSVADRDGQTLIPHFFNDKVKA
jgi:hypothetical protein